MRDLLPSNRLCIAITIVTVGMFVSGSVVYADRISGGSTLTVALMAAIPLLYLSVVFPEIFFALFLVAGFYKADPRIPLPEYIDLTILFGLLVVLSILYQILKKRLRIPVLSSKIVVPYLGIALVMMTSLFYTDAPVYGLNKFLRFITITALSTFAPLFLFTNIDSIKKFFYTLIAVSTVMAVEAVFLSEGGPSRTALGSNYIALARITGMTIFMVFLCFIMASGNLAGKIFWMVVGTINILGFLTAGARGPVVALSATISVLIFLSLSFRIKRSLIKKALITTMIIVLGIGSIFYLFPESVETLLFRFKVLAKEPGGGTSVALRIDFIIAALSAMCSSPIIGLGIGGFSTYYIGQDKAFFYPHNIVLEVGSELGIIGLGFFLSIVGACLYELIRTRKRYNNKLYLGSTVLALYVYTFLNALLSGNINDNRIFFVWIGVTYALTKLSYQIRLFPAKQTVKGKRSLLKGRTRIWPRRRLSGPSHM